MAFNQKIVRWEDEQYEPREGEEGMTYEERWTYVMERLLNNGHYLSHIQSHIREALKDWEEYTEIAFTAGPHLRFDKVFLTNVNDKKVHLYVRFSPTTIASLTSKDIDVTDADLVVDATVEAIFQGEYLFVNNKWIRSMTDLVDFLALAQLKKTQLAILLGSPLVGADSF